MARCCVPPARNLRGPCALALSVFAAVWGGSGDALAQDKPPKPDTSRSDVTDIEIVARPLSGFERLNASRTQFGQLDFIGGLVLSSGDKRFGGWSGLALDKDGSRMLAVSDAGTWLASDLVYEKGRLKGLERARLGPLKARSGGRLSRDRDRDAEAVLLTRGTLAKGQVVIAFEQNHRLGVFEVSSAGVSPPLRYLPIPAQARRMRALKGFEAVAELRAGKWKGGLIAFAERLKDGAGHHSGWILAGGRDMRLSLTDIGGFEPTDAVGLANGDVIILERRFRWTEGVKMRLRRLSARDIRPGAVLAGETLLEADMAYEIDNMEALSVHRDQAGRTVLTILSDDNFNGFLQRTILLQFRLRAGGGPGVRAAR